MPISKIVFDKIRERIKTGDYLISVHASRRLGSRHITIADLEHAIINGRIIKRDLNAKPYPKCIFLGEDSIKGESLHVVCSLNPQVMLVTVYFPDEDSWIKDEFRK
jgi:hypothetical protein